MRLDAIAKRVKDEFHVDNLDFDESTKALGIIEWRVAFGHESNRYFRSRGAYLAFRCTLLAAMTGITIWSIAEAAHPAYWLIYLTHWGLVLEVLYLGFAVFTTYKSITWPRQPSDPACKALPWYVQTMWLLHAVILPGSFFIFANFWLLVFEPPVLAISVCTHGVNFAVMLADVVVGNTPYLLLHGAYFWAFAVLYLGWSLVHYALRIGDGAGNDYIYEALDWGDAESTGSLGVAVLLILAPLINIGFWVAVNGCCRPPPSRVGEGLI